MGDTQIAGSTSSFGAGKKDVFLVKTDSEGTLQLSKTYGGKYIEFGASLVQTFDGGYSIAGYNNLAAKETYYVFLVKTDSAGTMKWSNTYRGTHTNTDSFVVQANDGRYVIAGTTDSFGLEGDNVYLVKTYMEVYTPTLTPLPSIPEYPTWIMLL
jgi:hypothetical protein